MQIEKTFNQELSEWIKTKLPYWKQYLAVSILVEKKLTDLIIDNSYQYFLQEHSLSSNTELIQNSISDLLDKNNIVIGDYSDSLNLKKIDNFKNISAIKDGQVIEMNPELTVLFGENGAGKTSYIRLLNNVFQSRGEKEMLPNIYRDGEFHTPTCSFEFESSNTSINYTYPEDAGNIEFKLFTVFDSKSFRVHLDNKNELLFLPKDFEFFNLLIDGLRKIELKHQEAINNKQKENTFTILFQSEVESDVKKFISALNAHSSIDELKELATFTNDDEKKIIQLEKEKAKLISQDVGKRIKEENGLFSNLVSLQSNVKVVSDALSSEKINEINVKIEDFLTKKSLLEKSGVDQFDHIGLNGSGTAEWRYFINSAFLFSSKHYSGYPESSEERCILCNQILPDESKILISKFWNYLNSVAESEYQKVHSDIQAKQNAYKLLNFNQLDEETYLYQRLRLDKSGEDIVLKWRETLGELEKFSSYVLERLNNFNVIEYKIISNSFPEIEEIIDATKERIRKLEEDNPVESIKNLTDQIISLSHRRILRGILDDATDYIKDLNWISRANFKMHEFNSSSITRKQRELFEIYVSGNYLNRFNRECKILNAEFNVEISQEGKKGNTLRELKIKGYSLRQVLSEGEQRAISLADFLTEINLSNEAKGIILDDPVNSLDHKRKRMIAERFVEESQKRQVIIFTHDLMFVSYLKAASEKEKVGFICHWIQKTADGAGQVYLNNSPANESDYKNSTIANDFYGRAKNVGPQEQEHLLKHGFGALRTNYEAFVIFELFSDVVQRFNERISIDRLKSVVIDDDVVKQVIEKTAFLSRYIEGHLHSDEYVFDKPTPELLLSEIQSFDELKKRQKSLKKGKVGE